MQRIIGKIGAGFAAVWSHRPGLGEGNSPEFAYESLALYPRSPISSAVACGTLTHFTPQVWNAQTIRLDGMATSAGQIEPPRLYDPAEGLSPLQRRG